MESRLTQPAMSASVLIRQFLARYPVSGLVNIFLVIPLENSNGLLYPQEPKYFKSISDLDSYLNPIIGGNYFYILTENEKINIGVSTCDEALEMTFLFGNKEPRVEAYENRKNLLPFNSPEESIAALTGFLDGKLQIGSGSNKRG